MQSPADEFGFTLRIHAGDNDVREITVSREAVYSSEEMMSLDLRKLDSNSKSLLGGWFRGISAFVLKRLEAE